MKYTIPEISWHNRDPVLSVDFQPKAAPNDPLRLATGGTDSHVLIWYIFTTDTGSANLEVAADLTRHQKAVNVVRWSPNGQYLASGDDESIIFIWKQNTEKEIPTSSIEQGDEQNKESWVIYKTLRGHMEDVLDLSWSADSLHLASGSVDNKLLVWEVARGRYSSILTDHKGFVQGVSWDPRGQLIASASSDRVFRAFDIATKKVVSRSSKATLPFPAGHPFCNLIVRLYHDDTLQTFYRRLQFSPDGLLVAVPAGRIEPEQGKLETKPINAVFIYTRYSLKVPVCVLPCDSPALVVRWSPCAYLPRASGPPPALPLPRRLVLAVATRSSVLVYDTQQKTPLALISNIHYTRLTDLSWSPCGRRLVASSTDGFCSLISFADGELGEEVTSQDEPMETNEPDTTPEEVIARDETKVAIDETKVANTTPKIDSFIKFKAPGHKSPNKRPRIEEKKVKTPVKMDVLEETAMTSWSDNSNNEIIKPKETVVSEPILIEDSEDMKLVYEDTQEQNTQEQDKSPENPADKLPTKKSPETVKDTVKRKKTDSPKTFQPTNSKITETPKHSQPTDSDKESGNFFKQARVTDMAEPVVNKVVPSPKAPRRVSFVTLSSPKNSKKKL